MAEDTGHLVAREQTQVSRYRDRLRRLSANPTYVMLRDAPLAGATRSRSDDAQAALRAAGSRLDRWKEAVAEAAGWLRADPPDTRRAVLLLVGRSIQLTWAETPKEDRCPPLSGLSEPKFSLRYLQDLVEGDLRTAERAVADVAAVLAAVRPRLDALAAGLDEAAARLHPAEGDADRRELTRLRCGLYEARALIAVDPLALEAAGTARSPGSAGLARIDVLEAGLTRLSGRLARDARCAGHVTADQELLRGRLDNSRIRARKSGLAERPELVAADQRARGLLDTVPCNLKQAQEAVHAYMKVLDDLRPRPTYLGQRTI